MFPEYGYEALRGCLEIISSLPSVMKVILALFGFSISRNIWWKIHQNPVTSCKTAIVLGSGGHTREMLNIIRNISSEFYSPRVYITSVSDQLSATAAIRWEVTRPRHIFAVYRIMRPRDVGGSFIGAVVRTVIAFFQCIKILLTVRPTLVICNGPGIAVPVVVAAWCLKICGLCLIRTCYIESVCRVKSFSLTAIIIFPFVDKVLVQWPEMIQSRFCWRKIKMVGRVC